MRTLSRLQVLRRELQDPSRDPFLRGRLSQLAGMLLVTDGLIGIDNPLDRRRGRPGVVGAIFLIVFGAIFLSSGMFFISQAKPLEGGQITTGEIVALNSRTSTDSDGHTSTTCAPSVSYRVDDIPRETRAPYSSSGLCGLTVGSPVEVSYLPDDPARARPLFDEGAGSLWIFVGVGAAIVCWGLVTFLLRLGSIILGVYLLARGRRLTSLHPRTPTGELVSSLAASLELSPAASAALAAAAEDPSPRAVVSALRANAPAFASHASHVIDTASSSRGPRRFGPSPAHPVLAPPSPGLAPGYSSSPSTSPPPLPTPRAETPLLDAAVPPAWYPDPDGEGLRWWDGSRWTPHQAPAPR